jgi:tetratricopeptide (TPR) repeat protein
MKRIYRFPHVFSLSVSMLLCGAAASYAQHGGGGDSGGAGGVSGNAGAVMKVPARKPTATRPTPKPRPGPKPAPDNSAQVDDALKLADEARQEGRNDAAERGYQLAAKMAPSDPRPYLGLGHLYYNQRKYSDAERFYTRAAGLSRGDSEPYARLAFTLAETQRMDEAVAAGRHAVASQPDNYYGYLALGWVLAQRGNATEAEAAYRKSISYAPQPMAILHIELARVLGQQRRYNDAATEAKKAVDIDGRNYSARFNYALYLQKLGQLSPSAQQYLEAINLNPKDGAPHSNVGLIYYMTENFSAAREHWSAAISLGSTYPPDRIGLLILDSRLNEAQAQLEDYTRKNGDDEDGWLMLGDLYRALGNDSAARVTDTRAAQIAPEYVGLRRPDLRRVPGGGSATSRGRGVDPPSNNEILQVNDKGQTTLMIAAGRGRADLIPGIVAAGVNVNAHDNDGDAALYYAASNGHADAVQALLRAGANVNAANKKGSTALIGAAVQGHAPVVRLLLARGARPNQADQDGDNALILASAAGKAEAVDALVSGGAYVDVQNKNGITPLMIAAFQGHTAVAQKLIAGGANVNIKAASGLTALSAATNKNHPDIADMLKRAGAYQ